ncbi:MAG: tetratricopeptide repeat protein [Verrucomicrobiota bacterium]
MQSRWASIFGVGAVLFILISPSRTLAQAQVRGLLTVGLGDIAAIKEKAETGDASAQVSLADSLISNFHSSDALAWYRKAALQGNKEGAYQVGRILLHGSPGIPKEQIVNPNPIEGIEWTFRAATNLHPNACREMSQALQQGLGVSTDLVTAYAWLQLHVQIASPDIVGKVELNQLALKMDSEAIRRAQEMTEDFKRGHWSAPVIRTSLDTNQDLRLASVTWGKTPLAIIGGKTLAKGESAEVKTKTASYTIRCLSIQKDSVLIAVEGESAPRLLHLK